MPAQLLLLNPGRRPRRRRASSSGVSHRHFTPAQRAAQLRFAKSARKNPRRAPRVSKGMLKSARRQARAHGHPEFLKFSQQPRSNPKRPKAPVGRKRKTKTKRPLSMTRKMAVLVRRQEKRIAKGLSPHPNPSSSTTRRRRRKTARKGHKKETPMARRRKSRGRRKRRTGARRRRLLSVYKAPRRRRRRAKSTGTTTRRRRSRISRRSKKRTSARRRRLLSAYGDVKANPRRRRRRAKKNPTKARRRRAKNKRLARGKRSRELAMGNAPRRRRKSRRTKSRRRRASSSSKATRLQRRAKTLRRRARGRRGVGASIMRTRAKALSLHARSLRRRKGGKGGLSAAHKKQLRASGLLKVNPSVGAVVRDMAVLLPQVGFTLVGMAGASMGASKLLGFLRTKAPSIPGINSVHAPAVLSALIGAVGYVALRMIGARPGSLATFLNRMAPGVFVGGMSAAALHTLSAVKGADGVSLGKKVGLPLGDYVVGDYVVGDYVVGMGSMPGAQAVINVDGAAVRLNGLGSGIFDGRTVGMLPDPREGARGTRYEPHMRELLDADAPEGNLAGSIFD